MTFERRGCLISMERWSFEEWTKEGTELGDRISIEDWIEFKDQAKKVVFKISFSLWEKMGFEMQGRIVDALRKLYG